MKKADNIYKSKVSARAGMIARSKLIILTLAACITALMFSACDPNEAADKSDNIKTIDAHYYIRDNMETNDRLAKTAVLSYRHLTVIPKADINIKSISFDAKSKGVDATEALIVNIYCVENSQTDVSKLTPVQTRTIELKGEFTNYNFEFASEFSVLVDSSQKTYEGGYIRVTFLNSGGNPNEDVMFSINNVSLNG